MTFIGVSGWKRGANRAECVMNIRHMQLAVRGYSNAHSLKPGEDTSMSSTPVILAAELVGPGRFAPRVPDCPGRGIYSLGGNSIPEIGSLYMSCSLGASDGHVPAEYDSW
jgi:hypothetical protein